MNHPCQKVRSNKVSLQTPPTQYLLFGPAFNPLFYPLKNMYLITENEDPPPNASLSGPPHLLSKSLTKAMTSVVDSMHDQMTSFINFSIGW